MPEISRIAGMLYAKKGGKALRNSIIRHARNTAGGPRRGRIGRDCSPLAMLFSRRTARFAGSGRLAGTPPLEESGDIGIFIAKFQQGIFFRNTGFESIFFANALKTRNEVKRIPPRRRRRNRISP